MAEILRIMLDAGHGGSDPGAVANGIKESEANLVVAKVARDNLLKLLPRAQVYMTRESNVGMEPEQRKAAVRKVNPHVCVSIHHNSAENINARGVEVFHAAKDRRDDLLAELICDKVSKTGIPNRGIKTKTTSSGEDYFYMIRDVMDKDTVGVLSEGAFLTNKKDADMIKSGWLEAQGKAIAEAIAGYLKTTMPDAYQASSNTPLPPMPTTIVPTLIDNEITGKMESAYILNGKTYMELRATAEALGLFVHYVSQDKPIKLMKRR